ncbi:MAG: lysophospholipid acyltransferase family protein [Thermoleophilaceae bacterium]|jgi:1-acyl-sn-glycerol-3-phosphate acyltransferase
MATAIREALEERRSPTPELPNAGFIRLQQPFWNFLLDRWFRLEVRGWSRLPEAPGLLIGVHAGGILPIDAYAFGYAWFRKFGQRRPLHGTAHDFLMTAPVLGDYLRQVGTVPASAEGITTALDAGYDVVLYPGGDLDSLRPWTKRDKVELAGRKGFVRQAIRAQVPIVPVASSGAADTLFVLTDGRRLAKLFRFDKLFRSKVFPIAVGFPLGLAPGVLPQIPLPAKLRTEILDPIDVGDDPEREHDNRFVARKYREVEQALQDGMNRLARKRKFPLLG